ncbi:hypothetical protein [Acidilobus sp.]|uniref:hypothetical protein n=1 Tax=Acidilobus sp. TaxID=1872109 RepID=UPI003D027E5D
MRRLFGTDGVRGHTEGADDASLRPQDGPRHRGVLREGGQGPPGQGRQAAGDALLSVSFYYLVSGPAYLAAFAAPITAIAAAEALLARRGTLPRQVA